MPDSPLNNLSSEQQQLCITDLNEYVTDICDNNDYAVHHTMESETILQSPIKVVHRDNAITNKSRSYYHTMARHLVRKTTTIGMVKYILLLLLIGNVVCASCLTWSVMRLNRNFYVTTSVYSESRDEFVKYSLPMSLLSKPGEVIQNAYAICDRMKSIADCVSKCL